MTRYKNYQWSMSDRGTLFNGEIVFQHDTIIISLLMDVRDELQKLNSILNCPNFLAIPGFLELISKNTRNRDRKKIKARKRVR